MKTKFFALLVSLSCVLLLCNSCHRGNSMVMSNGDYKLSVYYDGEIEIADDENDFESISPHGFVKYSKKGYRLYAEGNHHGDVQYELSVNGHDVNPDSQEGKTLISMAIKDMLDMGFDAEGRIQRIYNKGGKAALLAKVSLLNSDYIKRMYLEWLLENTDLTPVELQAIASKVQLEVQSDYDKSTVLAQHSDKFFEDSASTNAWLAAAATIQSDYDKANALKQFMEQTGQRAQLKAALQITATVNSDYDKANIIRTALEHDAYSRGDYADLLNAINRVNSSYDKKELLKTLVDGDIPEGEDFNSLLKSINKVDGDFDRREVLTELAKKNIRTDEQWKGILLEASKINSEYDKAEILVECARNMPRNEALRDAYADAANSIKSEYDYGRVMKGYGER